MWRKFFSGRYGMDRLSMALLLLSVVLINVKYVWILGAGLVGYVVFRAISRDIEKRRQELQKFAIVEAKFYRFIAPLSRAIAGGVMRLQQRKTFVFVKCTKCKNTLRLPRNKGKLVATCPVCKSEFSIKT